MQFFCKTIAFSLILVMYLQSGSAESSFYNEKTSSINNDGYSAVHVSNKGNILINLGIDVANLTLNIGTIHSESRKTLYCEFAFGNETMLTNIHFNPNTSITCALPAIDKKLVSGEHDNLNATLTIKNNTWSSASKNIAFFNCGINIHCKSCISSSSICNWCNTTSMCYYEEAKYCTSNVVSLLKNGSPSLCFGSESCATYKTYVECVESTLFSDCGWCISNSICTRQYECGNSNYLSWIKHDIRKNLLFKMSNATYLKYGESENILLHLNISYYVESLMKPGLVCKITIENSKPIFIVKAKIERKSDCIIINCVKPKSNDILPLKSDNCTVTANLSLHSVYIQYIWSSEITFFDCHAYLTRKKCMDGDVKCYWCSQEEKCIYQTEKEIVCPNSPPSCIASFWPEKGPRQGSTNITIRGENLNFKFEKNNKGITVAGRPCVPLIDEYVPMKKISCAIEQSPSIQAFEGQIEVLVDGELIKSKKNFTFVDPEIIDIAPKEGFNFGGTELTIKGKNLNAGSSIKVFIGNQPCTIFLYNSSVIQCISNPSSVIGKDNISVMFDNYSLNFTNNSYKYISDEEHDENGFNVEPKGIAAGGINILIQNITSVQTDELLFNVNYGNKIYNSSCKFQDVTTVRCSSPKIQIDNNLLNAANPKQLNFWLTTNSTMSTENISIDGNRSTFFLYPNPEFDHFCKSSVQVTKTHYLIIEGKNINSACQKTDIIVKMGNDTCVVISLSLHRIICVLPKRNSSDYIDIFERERDDFGKHGFIVISIGDNFIRNVSKIFLEKNDSLLETLLKIPKAYVACGAVILFCIICLLLFIIFHFFNRKKLVSKFTQNLTNTQKKVDQLELRVAAECKEAFAELQTQMTIYTSDDSCDKLPFWDYRSYVMKILFSTINCYPVILGGNPILINKSNGLKQFEKLIMNRQFLLIFMRTLERESSFSMNDRVYVASMVMMTLQRDMEYATNILKTLMSELIEKYTRNKSQPKLLLRQTENLTEKMISAWFSFLLHRFLRESAGKPLYNLFNAINYQIKKGPVDMVTSTARYSLSETIIIRQKISYNSLTVRVNISEETSFIIKLLTAVEDVPVQVLDCDTITQVKQKIIDTIFHSVGYSHRPSLDEVSIKWVIGSSEGIFLSDYDASSKIEGEWRQINTLRHYGVFDGSILHLVSLNQADYGIPALNSKYSHNSEKYKSTPLLRRNRKSSTTESITSLIQNGNAYCREWHLVKPRNGKDNQDNVIEDDHILPEIYLTRLLAMKSSLQRFVDDLFEIIFKKTDQHDCFLMPIKYMFDFLDDQALQHGITDPEVVHIWKNNCLPLRFWVNLIKNPEFLFDVQKSSIVDSCLSVIAQVLMDSCSTTELRLNKNSATSKLLYAKEIPLYNKLVRRYYADIRNMPAISQQEMSKMLVEESRIHAVDFNKNSSVYELYKYAVKYKEELVVALENDRLSLDNSLSFKFLRVINIMSITLGR